MQNYIHGEGFRTLAVYRIFFRAELRRQAASRAAYDAEVAAWYTDGPGADPDWQDITCPACNGAGGRSVHYGGGENLVTSFERCHCNEGILRVNNGGQGYRFPHCIHGADLRVDHDIPCGYCEMGESDITLAQGFARERFMRFIDRWEWANAAPGDLASDTRRELLEWAGSLFPKA